MESVMLSREDIEEQVGTDSFTRGATYQRFGRVQHVVILQDGKRITALVQGSRPKTLPSFYRY